ncbi:MAG TPA: hypothetical protein VHU23_11415 [Rhizomicrobium sp.]|jgi:outer membrane protein assembly factor BamB|nr:hypothetical protein [Rhizomicrobium sp.]
MRSSVARRLAKTAALLVLVAGPAMADGGFLETVRRHAMLTSTISDNGDLNPYAVIVAPVAAGPIQKGDVLIDNFNNVSNLQGTGTTIVDFNPATKSTKVIANLSSQAKRCPGGVGLTTAMTMLQSGWIIVGSTPSIDGTTRTKGDGCLFVLDANGRVADVWSGPDINGPWGNISAVDKGNSATLFISMAGKGVPGPEIRDPATGYPMTVHNATVVRFDLSIPEGKPPTVDRRTVIADGFGQRSDRDSFMIGPTGLALSADGTLYVSDGLGNRIVAIDDAANRTTSAGQGRTVTQDGLLRRPLALTFTASGHLVTCNAKNGQVVEIDPKTGKQLYAQWVDTDAAQSPPGNGDLFGLAMASDGRSFYYVEDDMNTLMEGTP